MGEIPWTNHGKIRQTRILFQTLAGAKGGCQSEARHWSVDGSFKWIQMIQLSSPVCWNHEYQCEIMIPVPLILCALGGGGGVVVGGGGVVAVVVAVAVAVAVVRQEHSVFHVSYIQQPAVRVFFPIMLGWNPTRTMYVVLVHACRIHLVLCRCVLWCWMVLPSCGSLGDLNVVNLHCHEKRGLEDTWNPNVTGLFDLLEESEVAAVFCQQRCTRKTT